MNNQDIKKLIRRETKAIERYFNTENWDLIRANSQNFGSEEYNRGFFEALKMVENMMQDN